MGFFAPGELAKTVPFFLTSLSVLRNVTTRANRLRQFYFVSF
jgi:hypothetical protein